jgi:hypothetical protein
MKAKNGWEFGIQRGERLSMEEGGVALKGLLRDSLRQLLEGCDSCEARPMLERALAL